MQLWLPWNYVVQAGLELTEFCLYFSNAGIKHMQHHIWLCFVVLFESWGVALSELEFRRRPGWPQIYKDLSTSPVLIFKGM